MDIEKRGKELKEGRSIKVGSSQVVIPKHTGDTIKDRLLAQLNAREHTVHPQGYFHG